MSHKAKGHHPHPHPVGPLTPPAHSRAAEPPALELVIKSDSDGVEQAIREIIGNHGDDGVPITIIHHGVGDICKTDIMTAATGSRLILGFNVTVLPRLAELCLEQSVEVRLYTVIYQLQEDVREIARSLLPRTTAEKILGSATVIALFKGSRRGIILGCAVDLGRLQQGDSFRIISAMGPVYSGKITSLHIEKEQVNKATPGQQVGVKIDDFKNVHVGDLVECYQNIAPRTPASWRPSGKILSR